MDIETVAKTRRSHQSTQDVSDALLHRSDALLHVNSGRLPDSQRLPNKSGSLPVSDKHAGTMIDQRLNLYIQMMSSHPLFALAEKGLLSRALINEFAYLQYADSILWVPMLALMKERVKNPRLVRALTDNIACEAGIYGISHIELARQFTCSLGVKDALGTLSPDVVQNASHLTSLTEAQIAGWIFAAETLVPILFSKMRVCYQAIPGCDLRYLDEHIGIDSDEHSIWMREAINEILIEPSRVNEVLTGIDFGMREAMDVPDSLYAKAMWLARV